MRLIRLGEGISGITFAGDFSNLVPGDIQMTGISGLEMIPHVRELAPDTVVNYDERIKQCRERRQSVTHRRV